MKKISATVSDYGQCGGISWTGETICGPGYTCTVQSSYYSQCLPNNNNNQIEPTIVPSTAPGKITTNNGLLQCLSASNLVFYDPQVNPGNGYSSYDWLRTSSTNNKF